MRILIAEDDTVSRMLLHRALSKLEHDCVAVEDGERAWDAYQESEWDMVVSDWMMPGCDGLELCRRVRENPRERYTFFVLLTALDGKENLVAGMTAGADDYLTKPLDREALHARLIAAERILNLHRRLESQKADLEGLNQKLYEEGRVDALTRVGNRLRMVEDLAAIHDRVMRYGHMCCVGLCDVDFFKKYNDTCGHQAGDDTLRSVAQTLDVQSRVGDSVYRYGGEEFLVLLPEQDLHGAMMAMERLRVAMEALALPHPGKTPPGVITFSAGVSHLTRESGMTVAELLKQADAALYDAKANGRNQVACFQPAP